MHLRPALLTLVLATSIVVTACGGGSSDAGPRDGGSSSGTTTTAADGGGSAGSGKVEIADFAFDPAETEVAAGETVTFTNADDVAHTATAKEGDPTTFDTKEIEAGGSKEITFDEAGDYEYYCSIHEYMKGTIHVVG